MTPPREFERIPLSVRVEFRTASSFLVAYSVNLSRGGMFLETSHAPSLGSEVKLAFTVPGVGAISLSGRVAWRRDEASADLPIGIGIEFSDIDRALGSTIDTLVGRFSGLNLVVYSAAEHDRAQLSRMIRSTIGTADVASADSVHLTEALLGDEVDLVIAHADADIDGALLVVRTAALAKIPVVVVAADADVRDRAQEAGATATSTSPPQQTELSRIILGALGRPILVG
ncbi:MAG TPA: TIGR02266 family protein [Kofleriaceae bacterium]|nr:TIGR02266 family protein [Kofleriaceae bacterium]